MQTKPKAAAGRRRWGHSAGLLLKADDWEDYEDTQELLLPLGVKAHYPVEKPKQGAEAASRFRPFVVLRKKLCQEIKSSIGFLLCNRVPS